MSGTYVNDPMMEMYLFETNQLVNRLEQLCMTSEKSNDMSEEISEIFRIMHTIKGNSMMMLLEDIGRVAHRIEDLFDYLKTVELSESDNQVLIDFNFEAVDFFKTEVSKLEHGEEADGDSSDLVSRIESFLESLKFMSGDEEIELSEEVDEDQKFFIAPSQSAKKDDNVISEESTDIHYYYAKLFFDEDAQMENVRAFSIIHNLKELVESMEYFPADIVENDKTIEIIQNDGFIILFKTKTQEDLINQFFNTLAYIDNQEVAEITLEEYKELSAMTAVVVKEVAETEEFIDDETIDEVETINAEPVKEKEVRKPSLESVRGGSGAKQSFISVDVSKVDKLMDLVGELVVAESMVINNPDLNDLELDNFSKASRQLRLVINEMQDIIMSVRMVPLSLTFQKMNRIVRDMKKKVKKDVVLELLGEETEVDKNVIEKIGDPLMHIIRNAMDHGIENEEDRIAAGKSEKGKITLSARQAGGNVVISIKDDGKGLNKRAIYEKAHSKGLLTNPYEECSEQEIFGMILNAGFSTKAEVTEFSGRGVGMDVVMKNIQSVGGTIVIDSEEGIGTEMSILIPLTLAIVDGMMMRVGQSIFAVPIMSIKESFIITNKDLISDPDGNEMVMIREVCYPVVRLNEKYSIKNSIDKIEDGILVMIEHDEKLVLIFADELIGEQQVVVKSLSKYVNKIKGVSGFALLGDGKISLILDPSGLMIA